MQQKKRILILGAGRGQTDLIKTVRAEGHTAVVASIPGDYPGFALADEIVYVNIADREAVSDAAEKYRIDAIATSCLDTGIGALGYACDKRRLCGLSASAAEISNNKFLMKEALIKNGVSTAKYVRVASESGLEDVMRTLSFPLIVKAVDLQGSRGINIVHTPDELLSGYRKTMAETAADFCIVEEFIEGYDCGAQAFVFDGEILFLLPSGNISYLSSTNVPVGHYVPLDAEPAVLEEIDRTCRAAVRAVGLDNCAVNIDLIVKNGAVYVVELTGRVGANCLPELMNTYFSVNIYKMIVDASLGISPKPYFEQTATTAVPCFAKMILSEKTGILKEIVNGNPPDDNLVDITFFVRPGDEIRKFTNSKDCLGQVVVRGNSLAECRGYIESVLSRIHFVLE